MQKLLYRELPHTYTCQGLGLSVMTDVLTVGLGFDFLELGSFSVFTFVESWLFSPKHDVLLSVFELVVELLPVGCSSDVPSLLLDLACQHTRLLPHQCIRAAKSYKIVSM